MSRPRRELSDQQRAVLDRAWEAQLEVERAVQARDELAREAVALGASWREIAAAVRVSPQAAHQRYHPDRR
ncbi:MAG: hypothetical protein ACR2NR_12330 [Solirubrobacteraceae bacterium]